MQPRYKTLAQVVVRLDLLQRPLHQPTLAANEAQPLVHGLQLQSQVLQPNHLPWGGIQKLQHASHRAGLLQHRCLPHGLAHHEPQRNAEPWMVLELLQELLQGFTFGSISRVEFEGQRVPCKVFLER